MPAPQVIKEYQAKAAQASSLAQAGRGREFEPLELLMDFREALDLLKLERHHHVLDIGCANGLFDLILSACCQKLVALEPVAELASQAKDNLRGITNITILNGHSASLPIEDTSVDRVIMLQVLQLIPSDEHEQVVSEILRVMRPGGRAVFGSVPDLRHRDAFLEEYLTGVREATHLTKEQKKTIIERNLRATWLNPDQWSELWPKKEAETQVLPLSQGHPHASHRFHFVVTKLG